MSKFIFKNGEFKQVKEEPLTAEHMIKVLEASIHEDKPYGSIKDTKVTKSFIYDEDGYVIGHKLTNTI